MKITSGGPEKIAANPDQNNLKQNGLSRAREAALPKPPIDPRMLEAAQNMESMFIQEMLKAMRETVKESELSPSSNATKIYQSMLDSEYSDIASRTQSMGLAKQIVDYWSASLYPKKQVASPPSSTGGTGNENKPDNQ